MVNHILLYVGAALPLFWGIAHLFPTKNVVNDFGEISTDNKRIIAMEWIVEGVALIFVGILIAAVTYIDPAAVVSKWVLRILFVFLNVLSVVSLATGFKIDFIPFKLCPVIFTGASILVILGVYL